MGRQTDDEETIPGDPDSRVVCVGGVGTFGLSPASYWWTSISNGRKLEVATVCSGWGWRRTTSYKLGMSKKRADWLANWGKIGIGQGRGEGDATRPGG